MNSLLLLILFGMALLLGIWGIVSLVSAIIKSGGPVSLMKKWFAAVSGRDR